MELAWSQLEANYPIFILVKDYYDDFSYKTTFRLFYAISKETRKEIGIVRILDIGTYNSILPEEFSSLDKTRFCSLGDGISFYDRLMTLGEAIFTDALSALNDSFTNEKTYNSFVNYEGFQNSFLRYSSSQQLFKESKKDLLRKIYSDSVILTAANRVSFEFSTKLKFALSQHSAKFSFDGSNSKYDRIKILIGKNGTGKTSYLRNLALAISGEERGREIGTFRPVSPNIDSVIMISYSAFDSFRIPSQKNSSYIYCGLQFEKGRISHEQILEDISSNLLELRDSKKHSLFMDILKKSDLYYDELLFLNENTNQIQQLSSGQAILLKYLTDIVKNIQENSIVLIDEIETHLHPNFLISLLRFLGDVLQSFNSFCILSTHSPLVVREIDLDRALIFNRIGNDIEIVQRDSNYIGENLGVIVDDIFNLSPRDHLFTNILSEIADRNSQGNYKFNDLAKALLEFYEKP